MQTFLPYHSFERSAASLDRLRLGKQRVETRQILGFLLEPGPKVGYQNHPAVRMWRGHEQLLAEYGMAVCAEWISRGYQDVQMDYMISFWAHNNARPTAPEWLGDPAFHRAHQSNLSRKLPDHYVQQWPDVPDDLPYVWPV